MCVLGIGYFHNCEAPEIDDLRPIDGPVRSCIMFRKQTGAEHDNSGPPRTRHSLLGSFGFCTLLAPSILPFLPHQFIIFDFSCRYLLHSTLILDTLLQSCSLHHYFLLCSLARHLHSLQQASNLHRQITSLLCSGTRWR